MRWRLGRTGKQVSGPARTIDRAPEHAPAAAAITYGQGWERRLHAGLAVARVPAHARAALARALGEAGVEAEFFLALIETFPPTGESSHAQGEILLLQLEAATRRISRVASSLEVASQGFLAEIASSYPDARGAGGFDEVWWPAFTGFVPAGEPLDVRLRRCGYSLRHLVEVHLASSVESIAEQMALTLHALHTLPPAGVVPVRSLSQGLYELASAWQGDVVQHYLLDIGDDTPGLLTAIAHLRALDTTEDVSLESDLAWARTQASWLQAAPASGRAILVGATAAAVVAREWQDTIATLEALRSSSRDSMAQKASMARSSSR